MRMYRIVGACILLACCFGCASGPAPERSPGYIRQSLRHLNKGAALYAKGCFPSAMAQFMAANEGYSAADHMTGVAASLNSIANVYYQLGDLESALLVFDEAIELFRIQKDLSGLVRATANKGAVLIADGQLDEARAVLDQADLLAKEAGILRALRLKNRALLLMRRNDSAGAKKLLEEAVLLSGKHGGDQYAAIHYTMGRLLLSDGNPARAMVHLNLSLETDRRGGAYFAIGEDLAALGNGCMQMAQYDQAVSYFKRSLKIFALLGNAGKVAQLRGSLEEGAARSGADIRVSLQWVDRWLAGGQEANLCR